MFFCNSAAIEITIVHNQNYSVCIRREYVVVYYHGYQRDCTRLLDFFPRESVLQYDFVLYRAFMQQANNARY